MTPQDARPFRWERAHIAIGILLFGLAVALYASRMATSFVEGDTAYYLTLANTGELSARGNGIPLYITFLNVAAKLPLPFPLSDGVRCNLLTVLVAATSLTICYGAALRLMRSLPAAVVAVITMMMSSLIWTYSIRILPHITLALIGSSFVALLIVYDETASARAITVMGLVCGLGFGLMPNAVLFLPLALLYPFLTRFQRRKWRHLCLATSGFAAGLLLNGALIVAHELRHPTVVSSGTSIAEAGLSYLGGGAERNWFLENLELMRVLRGLVRLPLEVAADFEIAGSGLALIGLIVGLRRRTRLHASFALAFATLGLWVGAYPGDTRVLHGMAVYPIAALWVACGAHWIIESMLGRAARATSFRFDVRLLRSAMGLLLLLAVVGGIAGGKIVYRERLCAADRGYLAGFCRERLPTRIGDKYLRRAQRAIDRIPEGALVFGAAWDATDQANYLIRVRRSRPDLGAAHDLTKLSASDVLERARRHWSQGRRVFLFGEWKDVENWSPELLGAFRARAHGEFLYELDAIGSDSDLSGVDEDR